MGATNWSDSNYLSYDQPSVAAVPVNVTMMAWFFLQDLTVGSVGVSALLEIFGVTQGADYDLDYAATGVLSAWNGSSTVSTGITLTAGLWFHITLQISTIAGGVMTPFINGMQRTQNATTAVNISAGQTIRYLIGKDQGTNQGLTSKQRVSNIKIWQNGTRLLTSSEIRREMLSYAPVTKQNLFAWWPTEDVSQKMGRDYAGARLHDATVNGTLNVTTDPPQLIKVKRRLIRPWRYNVTAAGGTFPPFKTSHNMGFAA